MSFSRFDRNQILLVAIRFLTEFWLNIWPFLLSELVELNQICWFSGKDPTFKQIPHNSVGLVSVLVSILTLACFIHSITSFNVYLGNTQLCLSFWWFEVMLKIFELLYYLLSAVHQFHWQQNNPSCHHHHAYQFLSVPLFIMAKQFNLFNLKIKLYSRRLFLCLCGCL